MNSTKKYHISKFFLFTLLFLIPLTIWNFSAEANDIEKKSEITNAENFQNIKTSDIGKTGIAITSNLGLRYGTNKNISDKIFDETIPVKEFFDNPAMVEDTFIIKNMIATKEYYSILKTDFRQTLKNTNNKEQTLESITHQLQIRLDSGRKASENIQTQKLIFEETMKNITTEIEKVKTEINKDFKSGATEKMKENLARYIDLKNKYTYLRTHLVFANKFLDYYHALNKYNENLLSALQLNRDIIVKGSYLIIPNDGDSVLKEYGLLYTESEVKDIIEKQEKIEEIVES